MERSRPWIEVSAMLGVGGLLWALSGWGTAPEARADLALTPAQVQALRTGFERTRGRAPTDDEATALIRERLDEEVLYREGVFLGLDRGDPIVRRRVVQKMGFVLEALTPVPEPDERELVAWLAADPDRYAHPPRVRITQVPIPDRAAADAVLAALAGGADPNEVGGPSVHPRALPLRDRAALVRSFGAPFARAVLEAAPGAWAVLHSGIGWHVVRVEAREDGRPAALDEVRSRVVADWSAARTEAARAAGLQTLRERWGVER